MLRRICKSICVPTILLATTRNSCRTPLLLNSKERPIFIQNTETINPYISSRIEYNDNKTISGCCPFKA